MWTHSIAWLLPSLELLTVNGYELVRKSESSDLRLVNSDSGVPFAKEDGRAHCLKTSQTFNMIANRRDKKCETLLLQSGNNCLSSPTSRRR